MGGLEQIISHIIVKAEKEAEKILDDAKLKSEEIMRISRDRQEQMIQQNEKLIADGTQSIISGSKSNENREKKNLQLLLKGKIINSILEAAKKKITELNTPEYQRTMERLLERAGENTGGEVFFAKRCEEKTDKRFIKQCSKLYKNLNFSNEYCDDISSGFIIRSGKVDINCSVDALFEEKQNELADFINGFISSC